MKKLFSPLAWLFMAVVMFASCLGDSEDESVYYKDTAISTMNRYLHTTSSIGTDSVYKQTYAGSAYKFYIDHVNRTVYNTDSLPYGTDAKHVVCIITSKNLGSIGIKRLISDSIFASEVATPSISHRHVSSGFCRTICHRYAIIPSR